MFYVLLFTCKLSSAGYTENSRSPTMLCIQLVKEYIMYVQLQARVVVMGDTIGYQEY